MPYEIPSGDFQIQVNVRGGSVECILNGISVVKSDFLDPTLAAGGIGFKTWSEAPGRAALTIKHLSIKKILK